MKKTVFFTLLACLVSSKATAAQFSDICSHQIAKNTYKSFLSIPKSQRKGVTEKRAKTGSLVQAKQVCGCMQKLLNKMSDNAHIQTELVTFMNNNNGRVAKSKPPTLNKEMPIILPSLARACGKPIVFLPSSWWQK